MRSIRLLSITCLLSVVTGCQMFARAPEGPPTDLVRLQGALNEEGGSWWLTPCGTQEKLQVTEAAGVSLLHDARMLQAGGGPLFADLGGQKSAPDRYTAYRFYRLQYEGNACDDPVFRRLQARAAGNEPFWSIEVNAKGMIIDRPEQQESMVLPFVEERLPEGGINLTSEANGKHVEVWLAPQRCVDSMSGNLYHLSAELRVDGNVQRGCAYYGGQRQ
jgi:putative lipoprotein